MTIRVTAEYFVQDKYYCILTGIHKYKNCKRKIRWRRFIVLCDYDKSVNGQADRYKNIESRNNKKSPLLPSKTQQCLSLQIKTMWIFFPCGIFFQHGISQELERFIADNHLCHFLYHRHNNHVWRRIVPWRIDSAILFLLLDAWTIEGFYS